ncbi:MAG: hypothetical protein GXP58_09355 [Deltaproteobacteria bacterium]|nr:hypothetical protein [Deltaproteobacteria bacterium]
MDISSNRLKKLVILVFCVLLTAAIGCSKPAKHKKADGTGTDNIQGIWKGAAQQTGTPNAVFSLQLNQQKNGLVWGTITSKDGTFEHAIISDAKLIGSRLTFTATANGSNFRTGRSYAFDAEVQGNKMKGTWKDILDRTWGPFTTERVVVKTPDGKDGKQTPAAE